MNWRRGLNPQQRTAVEADEGPALILAGPGSGKTRVLTHRVAYLIEARGVDPRHIMAVTFTNKAAREMKDRLDRLLGPNRTAELTLGTFHANCARFLRRDAPHLGISRDFVIYDADDQEALVKRALKDLNVDDKKYKPSSVLNAISAAKSELIPPGAYVARTYWHEAVGRVYAHYQDLLRANNALDFDDLLMAVVQLFDANPVVLGYYQNRYRYILVDEFQDTNTAQYTLLRQMAGRSRNLFVVGDEDQCLTAGAAIQTPSGRKPIETIRIGEKVLAASGRGATLPTEVVYVGSRPYRGELIRVTTRQGYSFRATPNHIVFARLSASAGIHYVYLMQKEGVGYRIGVTSGARSDGVRPEWQSGLRVRGNQEQADRVWILRACSSRDEALYWEAFLAFQYGIPTTVFHVAGRRLRMSQVTVDRLYQDIDTGERAERLLADLMMDTRYPHYIPKAKELRHVVNLRYFSDSRRSERTPWNAHRVSVNCEDPALRRKLEARGYSTRRGGGNTWRAEFSRLNFDDAQALAGEISRVCGNLEISVGAFLVESSSDEIARRFSLMPVSHLHPTMIVAAERQGRIVQDEIVQIDREAYKGKVYDLEVQHLHNYLAGGVVVHNSIYRFRGADFRNVRRFQQDYPDAQVILLEQNYRSTQTILDAARGLIRRNRQRTDKRLFTERSGGAPLSIYEAYNEDDEALYVVNTIEDLIRSRQYKAADFAVFYRTNAQSRPLEEAFIRAGVPYRLVGGTRFYARREIKDVLAHLHLVHNPHDAVSLARIVNVPPRGVGAKTLAALDGAARATRQSPYTLIAELRAGRGNPALVSSLTGKARQALVDFATLLDRWIAKKDRYGSVADLLDAVVKDSGYRAYVDDGSEEGRERWENVRELRKVASDYTHAVGGDPLAEFLEDVALVSDVDSLDDTQRVDAPTLMTLHSAKGLEFPVVFITGLEEGVLPHARSLEDPDEMEEERRLAYVGITRAQDRVYLSYAFRRTAYGSSEVNAPSRFLSDIPTALLSGSMSFAGATPRAAAAQRAATWASAQRSSPPARPSREPAFRPGQRVKHARFGEGVVVESRVQGDDEELAVAFEKAGIKRLLASFANLEKLPG
ncbi:MAG TPA: UvrD-helicase domain-containing protein [Anaerolineae bacterium]|nr:UvrD-helicase domain-containing protein [Anaerolineae bacterium]